MNTFYLVADLETEGYARYEASVGWLWVVVLAKSEVDALARAQEAYSAYFRGYLCKLSNPKFRETAPPRLDWDISWEAEPGVVLAWRVYPPGRELEQKKSKLDFINEAPARTLPRRLESE